MFLNDLPFCLLVPEARQEISDGSSCAQFVTSKGVHLTLTNKNKDGVLYAMKIMQDLNLLYRESFGEPLTDLDSSIFCISSDLPGVPAPFQGFGPRISLRAVNSRSDPLYKIVYNRLLEFRKGVSVSTTGSLPRPLRPVGSVSAL